MYVDHAGLCNPGKTIRTSALGRLCVRPPEKAAAAESPREIYIYVYII